MSSEKKAYNFALPFQGKRVIVTGASSGIGRATAIAFAERGATVAIIARRKDRLDELVAKDLSGRGFAIQADFFKSAEVTTSITEAIKKLGGLDVLVNNVGGSQFEWLNKPINEQLQLHFQFNVETAELATHAALAALKESKGNVVNVGSIVGTVPNHGLLYYSVAKAALHSLTQASAIKYVNDGIRFNVVAPGPVETEIFDHFAAGTGSTTEDIIKQYASVVPIHRVASAQEIATSITYLADNVAAGFTTGSVLNVDGGVIATTSMNKF